MKGLSIQAVGGHGEVGRNCTAVRVDDEVFILDLGLHLENYVRISEDEDLNHKLSKNLLIKEGAVPDISILDKDKVKAVLISHAHLDHVGAVPILSNSFNADIHGTPFTIEVARRLCNDKHSELRNTLVSHTYNEIFSVSDSVSAEFIEVTHSTPQSAAIALHTPYGVVLYVNDFKLDEDPLIGGKTDLARMKELKVKVLILDTLYAQCDEHCRGERHAQELLEAALLSRDLTGKHVLVTTFSSQIARINTLCSIAAKMNRKVMIVGRSMAKYLEAAKEVGVCDVIDKHETVRYGSKVKKTLAGISTHKDYLFIVTGGMAEPKAVLSRIIEEEMIPLRRKDVVVFSNTVIPVPSIIEGRARLEKSLMAKGFEVLKDLHVSGHGAGRDMKTLLETVRPEMLIPVHADEPARLVAKKIALQCGLTEESVRLLVNGEKQEVSTRSE